MARRKPEHPYPVKDLAAANTALAEIAIIKRTIADIENGMNARIDAVKAEAEADVAPLQRRLAAIETGLSAFAEFFKEDLFGQGRRSKELDFGRLGYRRSTEIRPKPKCTLKMVLGKLKAMGFAAGIRVSESVNKDELSTWPDERLDLVDARRVRKDQFWYEIDEAKIAEKNRA